MASNRNLVDLLDLCILTYQLHAQTLIWPLDPYAEEIQPMARVIGETNVLRKRFFEEVRKYQPSFLTKAASGSFGSGQSLWNTNDRLDPVLRDYTRLNPWEPGFTRPDRENPKEGWIVYRTPSRITERILKVFMVECDKASKFDLAHPVLTCSTVIQAPQSLRSIPPQDLLYCFEGGTGAKGDDLGAAWSLMGFVLARADDTATSSPKPYDVYIAFRGSRSGKTKFKKYYGGDGNPDWVTDLALGFIEEKRISEHGKVFKGFAQSQLRMLPAVMRCCSEIHVAMNKVPPRYIYVTGHSLGGALAVYFTSAIMRGKDYGPDGAGPEMQKPPTAELLSWPWKSIKLTTFSAPKVGDSDFKEAFGLTDVKARRVRLPADIVTKLPSSKELIAAHHVGEEFVMDKKLQGKEKEAMGGSHDPQNVRPVLIRTLVTRGLLTQPEEKLFLNDEDNPWRVFTRKSDWDPLLRVLPLSRFTQPPLVDYLEILANFLSAGPTDPLRLAIKKIGIKDPADVSTLKSVASELEKVKWHGIDKQEFLEFMTLWLKLFAAGSMARAASKDASQAWKEVERQWK